MKDIEWLVTKVSLFKQNDDKIYGKRNLRAEERKWGEEQNDGKIYSYI